MRSWGDRLGPGRFCHPVLFTALTGALLSGRHDLLLVAFARALPG